MTSCSTHCGLFAVAWPRSSLWWRGVIWPRRHEPAFYRKAMDIDRAVLGKGSDRMLQQTTALASAVQKAGHWEALFTAEQINGWLAVDMVRNHPHTLPPELHDPRVAIDPERITVACRFDHGRRPQRVQSDGRTLCARAERLGVADRQ